MPLIPEYRAIHGTASKSIGEAKFARFGLMLRKAEPVFRYHRVYNNEQKVT